MPDADKPTLDARTLRELGETADGERDSKCAVLEIRGTGGELEYHVVSETEADKKVAAKEARILFLVYTKSSVQRVAVPTIAISVAGVAVEPRKIDGADAFFWSESSVEKFLFPYYESLRIWAPEYAKNLKKAFYKKDIIGVLHFWPSIGSVVKDPNNARFLVSGISLAGPTVMTLDEYLAYSLNLMAKSEAPDHANDPHE